jgi:hypothetical protein
VTNGWKILQIIPAHSGWKAVHCQESEDSQVKISNRAIICWALVEATGDNDVPQTEVRGVEQESNHLVIVGDLIESDTIGEDGVDRNQYFLGYDDPEAHKESNHWIEQANARIKTENCTRAMQRKSA